MGEMRSDTVTGLLHAISCTPGELPERFQNPFRYAPCPAVTKAAQEVMLHIGSDRKLDAMFSEGKMLGVLIVRMPPFSDPSEEHDRGNGCRHAFLAAFSGNVCGLNDIPYFVPPISDLLAPGGHFKTEEARISVLNRRIGDISGSPEYISASEALRSISGERDKALAAWKDRMRASKLRRKRVREVFPHPDAEDLRHYGFGPDMQEADRLSRMEGIEALLIRESQFEKAEYRRISEKYEKLTEKASESLSAADRQIAELKERRRKMSESLQKWISDNFIVMNALGESQSISAIFRDKGLVPPGGTGECAAPKLLQFAYRNGLTPVAMGEFWYGKSPSDEIRAHGRFYPSCTGKCGPLLGFMLQGLDVDMSPYGRCGKPDQRDADTETDGGNACRLPTVYEDDFLTVIDKPSGIPSVPGRAAPESLLEMLRKTGRNALEVHRLDMDTSGLIVFAKDRETQRRLRRQFEHRETGKCYLAVLDLSGLTGAGNMAGEATTGGEYRPDGSDVRLWGHRPGEKGTVSLPLSPDMNDRPRQVADKAGGKEAVTEYEIISEDAGRALVKFRPLTGRTHQLRVHSAHQEGLGAPIAGDTLYGSASSAPRLMLHASFLSFTHPATGERMEFTSAPEWQTGLQQPEGAEVPHH